MSQIRNIESLNDLLIKAWFNYDKAVTAVLRTMGFNSVKRYIDSKEHEKNYYRIINKLKSKPKDGTAGILSTAKEVINSEQFKTLIWIEDNVQKHQLKKHGSENIEIIANQFIDKIESMKKLPGILDIDVTYQHIVNMDSNNVVGDKNKYVLTLKISYDQSIRYIPKHNTGAKPFKIKLAGPPITQIIPIEIKNINLDLLYKNQFEIILNSLITEEILRDSFKFSGPCMFIASSHRGNSNPIHGCLGSRDDEYREIVKEANIVRYLSFISIWSNVYVEGSTNPYRNPNSLINDFKVKGFSEDTPNRFLNEESCIVPDIDITERKEYATNNMRGQKYKKYCESCSFDECNKSLLLSKTRDELVEEIKETKLTKNEKRTFRKILLHFVNKNEVYFEWRKDVDTTLSSGRSISSTLLRNEYIQSIKHLLNDSRGRALELQLYNYAITDINWWKTHKWINKKQKEKND